MFNMMDFEGKFEALAARATLVHEVGQVQQRRMAALAVCGGFELYEHMVNGLAAGCNQGQNEHRAQTAQRTHLEALAGRGGWRKVVKL